MLIQTLEAIKEVHEAGFIHRDVKPSNFVLSQDQNKVFIVDFGLASRYVDETGAHQKDTEKDKCFKGTVSYASLNAHEFKELSRRDDMWSYFFMMLELLGESLSWRSNEKLSINEVKDLKKSALAEPEKCLFKVNQGSSELNTIFKHINSLSFEERPNYQLIKQELSKIFRAEMLKLQLKPKTSLTATNGQ